MSTALLPMRVAAVTQLAPTLRHVVLVSGDGGRLPPASAGAHIALHLEGAGTPMANAYSLVSAPGSRMSYEIIVRRAAASRGGSAFIHDELRVGQPLQISVPHNFFSPVRIGKHHLMIAGGIGITPFLSYLAEFRASNTSYALRVCCREDERNAFGNWLRDTDQVSFHHRQAGSGLDISALLLSQPAGTHLYVCGPQALNERVLRVARHGGWPDSHVHVETFGAAPQGGAPFRAVLQRSGIEIGVGANVTLLEAIEQAGVKVASQCRGGACGVCELAVLAGTPEHRDHYLSSGQRESGHCIMPCVSRAATPLLVLDL